MTGPGPEPGPERAVVAALLGRDPAGPYEVVVRRADGTPSVLRNAPLLDDGTPMPTRYWLVDPTLRQAVSRLEAAGGVRAAEAALDPGLVADAHVRYAEERDAAIPPGQIGPRPSGGVGGTRRGVKCLHAHLGWWLAGGDDPVGEWVAAQVGAVRHASECRPVESRPVERPPSERHGEPEAPGAVVRETSGMC